MEKNEETFVFIMETLSLSGGQTKYQCVLLLTYLLVTSTSRNMKVNVLNWIYSNAERWIMKKEQDFLDPSLSCGRLMKEAAQSSI